MHKYIGMDMFILLAYTYIYIYIYIYIYTHIHFPLVCCSIVIFIVLCHNICSAMLFVIFFPQKA